MHTRNVLRWLITSWLFLCIFSPPVLARDPQNCLFCHKYQRLRAYDEKEELQNFYVDAHLFNQSIHRAVSCIGCHSDVEQIPHRKTEKVDCAKVCHLEKWKASLEKIFHTGKSRKIYKKVSTVLSQMIPRKLQR